MKVIGYWFLTSRVLVIITKKLQSEIYIKRQYSTEMTMLIQRMHLGYLFFNLHLKTFVVSPLGYAVVCVWLGLCIHCLDGFLFIMSKLLP